MDSLKTSTVLRGNDVDAKGAHPFDADAPARKGGFLALTIKQARGIQNKDISFVSGKSDAFVRVTVDSVAYLTKTVENSVNPVFNQVIRIPLPSSKLVPFLFEVVDDDTMMGVKREEIVGKVVAAFNFKSQWRHQESLFLDTGGELEIDARWVSQAHLEAQSEILLQVSTVPAQEQQKQAALQAVAPVGAKMPPIAKVPKKEEPLGDEDALPAGGEGQQQVISEAKAGVSQTNPAPATAAASESAAAATGGVVSQATASVAAVNDGKGQPPAAKVNNANPALISTDPVEVNPNDPWNLVKNCQKEGAMQECWSHKSAAHIQVFSTSPAEPGYPIFFAARVKGFNGMLHTSAAEVAKTKLKFKWSFDGDKTHPAEHQECYTVETMEAWSMPEPRKRSKTSNAFNKHNNWEGRPHIPCVGAVVGYTFPKGTKDSVRYATLEVTFGENEKKLTKKIPFVVKKYDGPVVKRYEVRSLGKNGADFKNRFTKALIALKKNGIYDFLVHAHLRSALFYYRHMGSSPHGHSQAHNGPAFLPWHRLLHVVYENSIQAADAGDLNHHGFFKVDPAAPGDVKTVSFHAKNKEPLGIPWWDHTKVEPSIWDDAFFGSGDGKTGSFACSKRHEKCDWPINFIDMSGASWLDDITTLSRGYKCGKDPACIKSKLRQSDAQVAQLMASKSYGSAPFLGSAGFGTALERGIHNMGHNLVEGDMWLLTSPNDPIFFAHHGQVDRLWWNWQRTENGKFHYTPLAADQYNGVKTPLNPSGLNLKMCPKGQENGQCFSSKPGPKKDPNTGRMNQIRGIGFWDNGAGKKAPTHVEIRGQMWDSELWPWTNTVADVSCNPAPNSYKSDPYFHCTKEQQSTYVHKVIYVGKDSWQPSTPMPKLPDCCSSSEYVESTCAC
jgi:tyrosinase